MHRFHVWHSRNHIHNHSRASRIFPARGRIVRNCLNVAEPDIVAAIADGADLAALQATLKCGTEQELAGIN